MERSELWCPRCEHVVVPADKVNYPMTVGILGVLAAILVVFVAVTFMDVDWSPSETVLLTLLVTVLPFGYMRATGMRSRVSCCPTCQGTKLESATRSVSVTVRDL